MTTVDTTPSGAVKGSGFSKHDGGKINKTILDDGGADRVREVVVGAQLRELERRYARAEERLMKEVANLRFELSGRMEALEHHVRSEVEALNVRMAQESQDRQTAVKQLGDDGHQAKVALTKDLDGVRQAWAKSERELRQALLDTSKSLSAELRRVRDDLTVELTDEIHALEDGKVARSFLAAMLGDVVTRLNAGLETGGGRLDS